MGKGIIIGVIIGIVAVGLILTYTNTFDVLKPEIKSSVDIAKDAISKVNGKQVIEKTEEASSRIKNVTDKIKITSNLDSKK
jgi:hypothetical protein